MNNKGDLQVTTPQNTQYLQGLLRFAATQIDQLNTIGKKEEKRVIVSWDKYLAICSQ